jgi:hypothetical protein
MPARARFALDPAWWPKADKLTTRHVARTAEAVAAAVTANAPVVTGAFADSVWSATGYADRVHTGYVGSTDFARHLIEFGGARTPAYAPFRRAIDGTGLRLARI